MLLYSDVVQEEELPERTIFNTLADANLPFDYERLKDGTCITDADNNSAITAAEISGLIKVLRNVSGYQSRFNGGPEPIRHNSILNFVQPCKGKRGLDGEDLEVGNFGDYKCQRCGDINHVPIKNGKLVKPFECFNDNCGRKGPFTAIFPEDLIKPIWKLSLIPIETSSVDVYTSIFNFAKKYLVLKDEEYHILTLWVMSSWLVDDFQTCPYLCMIAPKSSGKTQVLNVLGELAYRALSAVSVTAASLFRAIELWHITLLIDEAEYQIKQDSEAGQALYGCLNGGYKRGSYAIRTEGDSSCRVPAAFEVFGFKAIASTKLFHPTLESRSIIINMSQGMPQKILIDPLEAEIIRAKLLFWRFETLGKLPIILPESKTGRLIEMFIPLYTVAQCLKNIDGVEKPISYEDLIELLDTKIKEMESQRKEEEQESSEAQIMEAITFLIKAAPNNHFGERESIKLKEVADYLIDEKQWEEIPGKEKVTTTVGRRLKVMGIETRHTNRGKAIEFLKEDVRIRLDELTKRYLTVTDGDGK